MDHVMMVLVMLTCVTKPLMSLLLMARMMHGRLHMVHELILLLLVVVIQGGLAVVVTVIISGIIIHAMT